MPMAGSLISLMPAIILYVLSIGPVKGFAFYLALSTIIDLLLAYLFIRPATLLAARSKLGLRPALFGIPEFVQLIGSDPQGALDKLSGAMPSAG